MRQNGWHESMLAAVRAERVRLASRRGLLASGARLTVGGMAALVFAASGRGAGAQNDEVGTPEATPVLDVPEDFVDDLDVLNYALTLELLENAFYRDGVGLFDLGTDPFGNVLNDYLALIGAHEAAHVTTLTDVITELGGTPVAEQAYDFSEAYADPIAFLETAQALENVGVGAYDGAGAAISDPDLLTAAGTIVAVEALHASYLNVVNGARPAPQPFEEPLSREQVLDLAAPFFAAGAVATPTS